MDDLHAIFKPGLRALTDDGSLLPPGTEGGDALPDLAGALFIVDLEMSGPNPREHEVLDVGGVVAALEHSLPEREAWGAKVRPKHIGTADPGALKLVGYRPKAWRDAIELEEAFARLAQVGAGAVIAGWGFAQDLAFLAESYRRLESPWPFAPVALDIQGVARAVLRNGEVDRFNLGHVADRLGIGRLGEHGALEDAYATYDVLVKIVAKALGQAGAS